MHYPSESIKQVVEAFARLPGIGRRTAMRLALHLLKCPEDEARTLGQTILQLRERIRRCRRCGNLTDTDLCALCRDTRRNHSQICVVEEVEDLMALEKTQQYHGLYHVLGGLINPMAGVGPDQLNLALLLERARHPETRELILALNSSMEGETTAFYIVRQLQQSEIRITNLARGVPIGSHLEYTDDVTLARSLLNRTDYPRGHPPESPDP